MATPKPNPASDPRIALFKSIGLAQPKAVEAAKNPKASDALRDLIESYNLAGTLDDKQASVVTAFAGQLAKGATPLGDAEKEYAIGRIKDGGLKTVDQAIGAYLTDRPSIFF